VLAFATGGRGLLTWVMAGKVAGVGLYPLALGVLVLSRAYGVARSAALPRVKPPGVGLVSVSARVNVAGTFGTAIAGGIGVLVSVAIGSGAVLYVASVVLVVAGVVAIRLPDQVDEARPETPGERVRLRLRDAPREVRAPLAATAGVRGLQGLLTLFLAFFLRAEHASKMELALILGSAAVGSLLGTVTAARVPALSPRRLPYFAAGFAGLVCSIAALQPHAVMLAAAAGATGLAGALAKFGLDATVQSSVDPASVSSMFARSETTLQLAWVAGAGLALLLPARGGIGLTAAAVVVLGGLVAARRVSSP
jgi:hypothetical protein